MQCIHYLTAAGFIFADKIPCNHELSDNKYSWMITFTHFYTFLLCSYRIHSFYKFVETESLEPPRPTLTEHCEVRSIISSGKEIHSDF